MGRLALIGRAGRKHVVRSHRDVDLFEPVPVQVTEQEVERSVLVLLPPLVPGSDVLAPGIAGLRTYALVTQKQGQRGEK